MDAAVFEAIAHGGPHVVLGKRLRPLSTWHEVLLDQIDSPFADKANRKQPLDRREIFEALFLAVEICLIASPARTPEAESFRARWRRRRAVKRFYVRSNKLEILQEQLKFHAYLADYRSHIEHTLKEDAVPVQTSRWLYSIALFRRYNPDVDLNDIWKLSPGFIAWQNTAAQEAAGIAIEIMSENRARAHRRAEEKSRVAIAAIAAREAEKK